jgi:hypothetical protein
VSEKRRLGKVVGGKVALVGLLALMLLLGLTSTHPILSAAEVTDSVSIGFNYSYWDVDESITITLVSLVQDMTVGVDSGFILSMPAGISITTDSELVSPTTQSATVTLVTEDAHFQLNFAGYVNFSGAFSDEFSFFDIGFDEEFNPLEPVHIEGVDIPLLYEYVVEMGVSIDLDIDAYVTADLYRGNTLLEHLRWEDSGGTKSFSYPIPEASSTTSNMLTVRNIAWNYDLTLDLDFYATINLVVWSGTKDIFTIPVSLPSTTEQKTETANVPYTIRPPIPPEVSFTTLTSNATVSGIKTISANATDDKGVNRVEFWVDGVRTATDYDSPYDWSWDTTSYSDGAHTVKVIAYDDDGKSDYQQYSVTVRNAEEKEEGREERKEEEKRGGKEEERDILPLGLGIVVISVVVGVSAAFFIIRKH